MAKYKPFDQKEHLGEPPWSGPELDAWEKAHGHDVRVKCYAEYGCLPLYDEWERLGEENTALKERITHLEETVTQAMQLYEWAMEEQYPTPEFTQMYMRLKNRADHIKQGDEDAGDTL